MAILLEAPEQRSTVQRSYRSAKTWHIIHSTSMHASNHDLISAPSLTCFRVRAILVGQQEH